MTPATVFNQASFIADLGKIVGSDAVITDPADLAPYITDIRGDYHSEAICVVEPRRTEDVAALVRHCAEHGVTVTPIGGNTGLCGGTIVEQSDRPGIAMSFRKLAKIRHVDPAAGAITVEAGCILQTVQTAAREQDMLFPLSFGSEGSCQIGGAIATNAGGTSAIRYGVMRDLVLGLEFVTAAGEIISNLTGLRKDNSGYDLGRMMLGTEGTLGIVTAASLKLFPAPKVTETALVAVPDVEAALQVLSRVRSAIGDRISAAELIDRASIDLVCAHVHGCAQPFDAPYSWYVLLEAFDTALTSDLSDSFLSVLSDSLEAEEAQDAIIAQNGQQAASLWKLRHSQSEALRSHGPYLAHDNSVPLSAIPAYIARTKEAVLNAHPDMVCVYIGHLGDGNIHLTVQASPDLAKGTERYREVSDHLDRLIDDITADLGGSVSAEHGIGLTYRHRLTRTKSSSAIDMMRMIKRAVDPSNILNPGKVFKVASDKAPEFEQDALP